VGQLVELLRQTNIEAILQDFGKQSGMGREDPVIHFYELFLTEYDKEQLEHTIRLMDEIDQAIESHGGWPSG